MTKFALGERYNGSILLLAAQDDFVQNVRRLQFNGLVLAILVGAAFLPIVWMFGSRMSRSLQGITAQARQLQTLARATYESRRSANQIVCPCAEQRVLKIDDPQRGGTAT